MATKPDYARIYEKYHSSPKAKKDRAARNKARRDAEAAGKVKKGDGKDVHHVNGINNKKTRVMSVAANRSKPEGARIKGSTRDTKNRGK